MTWAAAIAGTLMDDSSWTSRWFPLLSIWNKEHRGLWGSWGQVRRHLEASSWLRETAQPWAPGERAQHRQNSSLGASRRSGVPIHWGEKCWMGAPLCTSSSSQGGSAPPFNTKSWWFSMAIEMCYKNPLQGGINAQGTEGRRKCCQHTN